MYEDLKESYELTEVEGTKNLKVKIIVDFGSWTQLSLEIVNRPLKLFKFFEDEKVELEEKYFTNMKIRKGKKFLKFLDDLQLRDAHIFCEMCKNNWKDIDRVKVAYVYDIWRMA